jgi:hypothetical protein
MLGAFVRVAILIALFELVVKLLGPPIAIFLAARQEATTVPGVKITPQPLSDYSPSDAPGTRLSYFGYAFEVPWNANFKQNVFSKGGVVQLGFESGQSVIFIAPEDQNGLLTEIVKNHSLHMENLQFVLGDLMSQSPYDQYHALLYSTPSGIRAFGPRAKAVRETTLLTIKAIAIPSPGLEKGLFSFELPDKRGFQIGDPKESRRVDLEVFDIGGHYVEIICETTKAGLRLSQPELNRILKSIHVASAQSSKEASAYTTSLSQ